jgi:ferredoxin
MSEKLIVNPIECKGNGACAELLPEMITLDEWGYPIIDSHPIPPALDRDARAAVSACPTLALRLLRSLFISPNGPWRLPRRYRGPFPFALDAANC